MPETLHVSESEQKQSPAHGARRGNSAIYLPDAERYGARMVTAQLGVSHVAVSG